MLKKFNMTDEMKSHLMNNNEWNIASDTEMKHTQYGKLVEWTIRDHKAKNQYWIKWLHFDSTDVISEHMWAYKRKNQCATTQNSTQDKVMSHGVMSDKHMRR